MSPQILMGASSSRRMGCLMKMERAFEHRYRISCSSRSTCWPGLEPRTSSRRSMMLSTSTCCSMADNVVSQFAERRAKGADFRMRCFEKLLCPENLYRSVRYWQGEPDTRESQRRAHTHVDVWPVCLLCNSCDSRQES